jgi:RHS repeat-associated protein
MLTTGAMFAQVPYAGNDADSGVTRVEGFLDPYTGNLAFGTHDIVVAGAVGQRGLTWDRCATSRTSLKEALFGLGHNWAHNWQWEMVDAGQDSQGRAVLSVRLPGGWVHRFTQTSPNIWWPEPSSRFRLSSQGDDFTIRHQDGGEVRFSRSHNSLGDTFTPREISDAAGIVSKLTWENGRLVQVTEPAGRWLKISYVSMSAPKAALGVKPYTLISKVIASDGQAVSYEYAFPNDADYPVLSKVTYPDGAAGNYTYAEPRAGARMLIAQVDDPHADSTVRGRSFRYYEGLGAATGQTFEVRTADGKAVIELIAKDKRGTRSYAVTTSNGSIVYRTFNPGGNVAEDIDALGYMEKSTYEMDGRGFKIASTDRLGRTTKFARDANGAVLKQTAPDGTWRSWKRDSRGRVLAASNELGQARRYTRDAKGRVVKVLFPDGSAEELSYNILGLVETVKMRSGAVIVMAYDDRGLRTKVTNALGHAMIYSYDEYDRLAAVNDPRGNTTSFERDAAGRITKVIQADGSSSRVEYNSFGQITKSLDATGVALSYVYDQFGRTCSVFDGAGGETRMEYATIGSDNGAPLKRPVKVLSPEGVETTISYDACGRITTRTVAAGTSQAATTRMAFDAAGRQTSITNARGKTTRFFFDERGRRTRVMNAMKNATTFTYDDAGRKLSQTDAKGNITRWTYDSMGRVLTTTDAKNQVTHFEYNSAGQRIALMDAKGNAYHFEFDGLGRQIAMIFPDGSRETCTFDARGNRISTTNRAGVKRVFSYDTLNREISSEWSDNSQKIVKAYDAAGRMTLEDNGVSRLSYGFDSAGRLSSETQDLYAVVTGGVSDPEPRKVNYSYTADGKRDSLTYPDGSFLKYVYNTRGQLQDILGDGVPPPIVSYEYDVSGNATRMPRENLTETAMDYDSVDRVTTIIERGPDIRRSPLSELDYTYDEIGNRTSTTEILNADGHGPDEVKRDTYTYDDIYQVTGVNYGAALAVNGDDGHKDGDDESAKVRFTYDAVGNRVQVTEDGKVTRYTINNLNQYTKVGEFMPAYDKNGNLAAMGEWLYKFDALNRLISASNGGITARFYYDAKNRCVARRYLGVQPGASSLSLNYYDNWNLIEERDASGKQLARYVHGRRIDEIVVIVNRHGVLYPHHDILGNVTFLTDVSGKIIERYKYSVEGKPTILDAKGAELVCSAVGNRWLYTGREWLSKVGVYDYRNRVYLPNIGRFVQTDPIRLGGGDVNIYRYVGNSCLRYADPQGLYFQSTHAALNQVAGEVNGLSQEFINAMDQASVNADSSPYQDASYAYMHSMANGDTNETQADAANAAHSWINYCQDQAVAAALSGTSSGMAEAASWLGLGAHAIEDSFAGGHIGYQPWETITYNPITWLEAGIHVIQDLFSSDAGLDAAQQQANDYIYDTFDQIDYELTGVSVQVTIGKFE